MPSKIVKKRNWAFVVYPESLPEGWLDLLRETGLQCAISPLHDKDKEPTGELKKAHYHVVYVSKNPVTADSVRVKIKRCLGDKSVSMVQVVSTSMENMYLYLTHESKDAIAKNKHRYSKADIKLLNNFDIDRYVTLDVEDKDDMLNDVCDLIDDHNLANMRELRRFIKEHGVEYGLPSMKIINSVLRAHTGLIR